MKPYLKVSSGLFIGLTRMAEELLEELEINPDILRENATKDYAASTTSRPTTTTVENTSSTLPPTTASTASTTITTTEKLGFWSLHTFRAYSLKMSRKCGVFLKNVMIMRGFFQVVALHYLYKLMVQQNWPNLTLLAFMTFLTLKIMI